MQVLIHNKQYIIVEKNGYVGVASWHTDSGGYYWGEVVNLANDRLTVTFQGHDIYTLAEEMIGSIDCMRETSQGHPECGKLEHFEMRALDLTGPRLEGVLAKIRGY